MNPVLLIVAPIVLMALWTVIATYVTMWGLNTLDSVSFPTWEWWAYFKATMPNHAMQQFVNKWLLIGGVAGVVPVFIIVNWFSTTGKEWFGFGEKPLYGTSKYATTKEGKKTGLVYSRVPLADCILLGKTKGFFGWFSRYVCLPGIEHVMLFAKSRSGKGVSYVIPNCFNFLFSLVVLDIKLENWTITAFFRKHVLGQEVYLFAPLSDDNRTHCWNPLGDIDPSRPDYISKLQRKAFALFPEVDGKEKFWQNGGRSAFLGIAVLVAETPGMVLNPATVFRFFTRGDSIEELTRLIESRRASGNPYSQVCVDLISDYLKGTQEVVDGIRKHVTATMGLWFNPKIAAATAKSDFDLRDLRRKRMTIYVGVMPADMEQLGVLLRLFFLQLFEANTDRLPEHDPTITHRVNVLWDEFVAVPVMHTIAKSTAYALGFWMQFSFIVQSKNQVREEYKGHGLASLLENVGAEVVFGTDDQTLCKEVSERAGDDTVNRISRSKPRFMSAFRAKEQNENISATKRPLILPQEVARLPADEEIMFRSSVPPFLLKRMRWYEDPNFMHLKGDPPQVPMMSYSTPRDDGKVRLPKAS